MADYSATGDPDVVQKTWSGTTQIVLREYLSTFSILKNDYLELKSKANDLYADLLPIYNAGLLPTGYTTQYNQLVAFVNL